MSKKQLPQPSVKDDTIQLPKAFWTFRRVITVSDIIHFLSLVLSILWLSSQYQNFAVDTLKDASADTLRHLVRDRLGERYSERITPLGDNFARSPETVRAVTQKDLKKLKTLSQVLFNRFNESGFDVKLRAVNIYDRNMKNITLSGADEAIDQSKSFFPLLQRRSTRLKRKIMSILWQSETGRPLHSMIIPVGGFRAKGFIELVTNPLPALTGIGSAIGGRITIVDHDQNILFLDGETNNGDLFQSEVRKNDYDTITVAFHTRGVKLTDIYLTRDISEFVTKTDALRDYLFQVVLMIACIVIFISWLLVRQTVYRRITNFADAMHSISQGQIHVNIPATGPDEMRVMAHSLSDLKEAVRKVEASERKLRELLEASPIGVAIIRSFDGLVIFGNSRIAEIYNIPQQELLNQEARDYHIFGNETKNMIDIFNQSNRVDNYEIESINKEGNPSWSLITMEPFTFQENESIIVWSYDITERVSAEKALRKRMIIDDALTRISRNFIDYDLQNALGLALEEVAQFTQSDRCYVFRRNEDDQSYDCIQQWLGMNTKPLENTSLDHSQWDHWIRKKLRDGKSIAIHSADEIPTSAKSLQNLFEEEGMFSFLIIPLFHRQSLIGFIGLDTVSQQKKWSKEDKQFVRLAGELIAIGLARYDAQCELDNARERFELAVSGTRDGIFDYNVDRNQAYVSNRWKEMLGMENHESYDGSHDAFLKLIYIEDRDSFTQSWAKATETRQSKWEYECRMHHRNGQIRWILVRGTIIYDEDNQPIRFVGAHTDFTERKEIEAELARKTSILEMTLESMSEGISVLDDKMNLVVWNDNFSHLLKMKNIPVPEGQKIDLFLDDHLPKDAFRQIDLQTLFNMFDQLEEQLDPIENASYQIVSHDDEVLEYHVNSMIGGGYLITYRDITEMKKVERLKNEFVSTVSHELRTPLTSIRGALGLIQGGMVGEIPAKAGELLDIANNNCERLIYLINDILDIEKIEAGRMDFKMSPHRLSHLIEEAMSQNRAYAERFQVDFHFENKAKTTDIYVDDNRLIQVITNLLSNAAKFSPQDEDITIETKIIDEIIVKVSVQDKGAGISEAFRSRIFSKFAQADSSDTRQKGGTGLGLSISKAIIEHMGGEIGFDTEMGKGTTFYFTLPIFKEQHEKAEISEIEPVIAAPLLIETVPDAKVLLCETDPHIIKKARQILQEKGYAIDVCHDRSEVKEKLLATKYDMLALGLHSNDQTSIEFLQNLKADPEIYSVPVIVISAHDQENQDLQLNAMGVVDWITKPIDENRLKQAFELYTKAKSEKNIRVLHIEDDKDNAKVVEYILQKEAHIENAKTIKKAKQLLKKNQYDLVILDVQLPDGSGLSLLPEIHENSIPVMVFSATDLSPSAQKHVHKALVKAHTTKDQFLNAIEALLKTDK